VVLNESIGKVRVVYTGADGGSNILYKESSTSNISFSSQLTLISGSFNNVTSTHQTFNPDVVILASNSTQAVGVLASDGAPPVTSVRAVSGNAVEQVGDTAVTRLQEQSLQAYPNPFANTATVSYTIAEGGAYNLSLYDGRGILIKTVKQGSAVVGEKSTLVINGATLQKGLYYLKLQTSNSTQTLKLMLIR
jgi:hypothetical protein